MTAERVAPPRVRTVFLGSGQFAVPVLHALAGHADTELVAVVTAPARPTGRRQEPTPTPVARAALEIGVAEIQTPERLRAPESIAAVLGLDPGLAVLADYGQIVPPALLEMPHGALNLHPSLLPRHRGATPVPAAILAGDADTGVTLMRMDAGLDTGPIVAQVRQSLDGSMTSSRLEGDLAVLAADLLADRLGPWVRGEIAPRPQAEQGVTLTRPLRREDGRLHPSRSATELERQVRAYEPWPGSFVEAPEGRIVVWAAHAIEAAAAAGAAEAGILTTSGLVTADGTLAFDEVQPAGGRRMRWADLLRGRPGLLGRRVGTAG